MTHKQRPSQISPTAGSGDLHGDELLIAIVNAAAAYFFPPLLVVTIPAAI